VEQVEMLALAGMVGLLAANAPQVQAPQGTLAMAVLARMHKLLLTPTLEQVAALAEAGGRMNNSTHQMSAILGMQVTLAAAELEFLEQAAMVPQERHKTTRQQAAVVDRVGRVEKMELGCNTSQRGTRAAMAVRLAAAAGKADTGMMAR
jgi:hypothetical protein